ncbi:MAG: metallophosphoesterase [Austwickia sp.]|nr:metallophosphoesterase [Austwickia sp.]MBK8437770.1 metallophosphoesterase [Austwickia sp.]MBK9100078.1 metallophosphoesterase [Austwickia sp.]
MGRPRQVAGGLGLAAGLGLAYAGLIERNAFTLRRYTVPVLPPGAPPVRILHLTDLHLMPNQRRKVAWVRALADLGPDMVLNTGDNLADARSVDPLIHAMEPFLGLPGAFVLGSNDYWAPTPKNPTRYLTKRVDRPRGERLPTDELVAGLASGGWRDLTNQRAHLSAGGVRFELVGVDDPHHRYDRYDAVAGPADRGADLTMGVVHAPYTRILDAMVRDGASLVMAGHTHGGQLALPFYGALVTNCDLDTRRAKGVTRWWPGANGVPAAAAPPDAAWMHVGAGLGTSPYAPVRFACRPEASLLTLVARAT